MHIHGPLLLHRVALLNTLLVVDLAVAFNSRLADRFADILVTHTLALLLALLQNSFWMTSS